VRPRELTGLRATLQSLPALRSLVPTPSALLLDMLAEALNPTTEIDALLSAAIADEPAVLLRDGGVIARGFDAQLDELRAISENCDAFLLELESSERARTSIANLREQYNRMCGFYIQEYQSQFDMIHAGTLPRHKLEL